VWRYINWAPPWRSGYKREEHLASRPPIFEDWPVTLPTPWGPYRAVVGSVYDGDTPRFWVLLGLDVNAAMIEWLETEGYAGGA
jgi:hypothetical protein